MITLFPAAKQYLIGRNEAEIRAKVAGEIAAAILENAHEPAALCDATFCVCCARAHQRREDAETARRIGGAK